MISAYALAGLGRWAPVVGFFGWLVWTRKDGVRSQTIAAIASFEGVLAARGDTDV